MNRTQRSLAGVVAAVVFNTTAFASSAGTFPAITQSAIVPLIQASQAGASNNDALLLLLDQFTALRGEMETLRGMVEEQGFELRRLQQDSLDRYTDLDSRISAIYQDMDAAASVPSAPGSAATPANSATSATTGTSNTVTSMPASPVVTASTTNSSAAMTAASTGTESVSGTGIPVPAAGLGTTNTPPVMMTEQQLYEVALDSLLQQQQYQASIDQFQQYLAQYPDGRFVTNAYYWQGQAYVNLSMFNEARQVFEIILNQYPDGRKIEDAMYSLGTVYHRLGDNTRAREMLQDVRTRFPNTSAANLSDIYLRTIN
ncbi:MAG: tol-pal system protein YbgF [Gammaproteobacteria bacterium]|nr:tol-pal system protein YbgF [Gammaproteobacteria bacterium]